MKQLNTIKILIAILFLVAANTSSFGQNTITKDSVYTLSFKENQSRFLYYSGDDIPWLFQNGNSADWSKPNINLEGWNHLSPKDLYEIDADENGTIEGWFRVKIKLDDSWKNQSLRLSYNFLPAAEVYIDGRLFGTYGNLGSGGQEFRYFSESDPSQSIDLTLNETHTIAIHVKDKLIYPTQTSSSMIGIETASSKSYFLVLQTFNEHYERLLLKSSRIRYSTLWVAINFIIGFLFFFLYCINKKEKNLLLYSGLCVSLGINAVATTIFYVSGLGHLEPGAMLALSLFKDFTFYSVFLFCFFSIIQIFQIKLKGLNHWLYNTFIIVIIGCVLSEFIGVYTNKYFDILSLIDILTGLVFMVILIYWTVISFKNSSLPQKVVAYGIILSFLIGITLLVAQIVFSVKLGSTILLIIVTAFYFCFPISLLIFVILRFQEINKNIKLNSEQILKLSEEKRVMAEGQQKLLEVQVAERTEDLQKSLSELKLTQTQLIQSEKMASLGELTAGIAHEIQNPLNFVNNFSEVSTELLAEMKEELDKGNTADAKEIADDVIQNLEKINDHGKRADAIVKGMLQHSRNSSGKKEPTDLNALCDEYVRLSYQGLRAKDKSFNTTLKTDFDDSIGEVNLIPQDFGRVILNLLTNAFYAVNKKQQEVATALTTFQKLSNLYEPTVSIATKKENEKIIITVTDNGNGMPQEVMDKIFQPFFTTKPTGQGTGLGLSLSYDIIKSHNGELKVESKLGHHTKFIITLPL